MHIRYQVRYQVRVQEHTYIYVGSSLVEVNNSTELPFTTTPGNPPCGETGAENCG